MAPEEGQETMKNYYFELINALEETYAAYKDTRFKHEMFVKIEDLVNSLEYPLDDDTLNREIKLITEYFQSIEKRVVHLEFHEIVNALGNAPIEIFNKNLPEKYIYTIAFEIFAAFNEWKKVWETRE